MLRLFIILVTMFAFSKVAFAADTTETNTATTEVVKKDETTDVNATNDKKEEDATSSNKAAK
jgi:hypothetical protein